MIAGYTLHPETIWWISSDVIGARELLSPGPVEARGLETLEVTLPPPGDGYPALPGGYP